MARPYDGAEWLVEPMDVQCERCKTEYEFDDALVSVRGTTVRCTNCGHQFKVRRPDARAENDDDLWSVTRADGRQVSFATLRELQRAILAKQVSRGDVLQRRGSPDRQLGAIAELEPFFQGRTSSRPPPADAGADRGGVAFPKRSAVWQGDGGAAPNPSLTPPIPAVVPARRTNSYGSVVEQPRRKMDTLRPPATGTAAPPPAAPFQIQPQPIVTAGPRPRAASAPTMADEDIEPSTRRPRMPPAAPMPPVRPPSAPDMSSPLPPPTRSLRRSLPAVEDAGSSMRPSMPSEEAYSPPRGRRVGGWVVAFVLMLAVGVVGWVVVKPYLVARNAGMAAQLDPRALGFVSDGERALTDGNLDMAKENFDKASALAEADPRVLLDQARLACALADVPWLKARLLAPEAADEIRATKAQLDERIARARRAADEALAIAPSDIAAMRAKIDALRLSGERDAARGYVSKVIAQASQPETAYVLAALDLAEPEPLWTTVIDRLRFAAAGEGNAGRARSALVYALAKSGDVAGATTELAKLDALQRPYPLLSTLHAFMDRTATKSGPDAGAAAALSRAVPSAVAAPVGAPVVQGAAPGPAAAAAPAPAPGGVAGVAGAGDGMQAAAQAIHKGDWEKARQIYDALVTRNPNDSEALCGLGDVARAEGDSAGAISAYKRVIAINPSYLPALLGLADTQWATGDRATAARGYRDIADRFPEGTYPAYVKQRIEGAAAPAAPSSGLGSAKQGAPAQSAQSAAARMKVGSAALWPALGLVAALGACDGRPHAVSKGSESRAGTRSGPWLAVLDLSDGVPEQSSGGWLGLGPKASAMSDLVREVERLQGSADLRGVLVRIGTARIGLARATEVGALLATLREKVPVWCHADDYANGTMYLAARGCRRIWAAPASSVDAIGIAAQTIYFHKLLTQELGLSVDFLQVGRFKGAEEPFTRDGPSPEARVSLETTLADLRAAWLEGLEKGRPAAPPGAAEDGPYAAQGAKDLQARRRGGLLRRGARRAREGLGRLAGRGAPRAGCPRRRRQRARASDSRADGRVLRRSPRCPGARHGRHLHGGRGASRRRRHRREAPRALDREAGAGRRREGGRPADRLARRKRARERLALACAHAPAGQEAARRQRRRHGRQWRLLPRVHRPRGVRGRDEHRRLDRRRRGQDRGGQGAREDRRARRDVRGARGGRRGGRAGGVRVAAHALGRAHPRSGSCRR